jgi:hypothetical protein
LRPQQQLLDVVAPPDPKNDGEEREERFRIWRMTARKKMWRFGSWSYPLMPRLEKESDGWGNGD